MFTLTGIRRENSECVVVRKCDKAISTHTIIHFESLCFFRVEPLFTNANSNTLSTFSSSFHSLKK